MPPINPYDLKQIKNQAIINKRILKLYQDSITTLTPTLSTVTYKGVPFKLSDYPQLKNKVDAVAKKLHGDVYAATVNGINDSWKLSNKKNDVLVDKRLAGRKPKPAVRKVLYDANAPALNRYITRKEGGMNLSDRVWNLTEPFKKELEQGIGIGIGKGRPAKDVAKELKQYLNEPDRLYRRVRGEDGKLYLSSSARNYNPGQGVYRSSYKNALRLTRTENNGAYRTADFERWQQLPFITGIHIKLSNSHPAYDICDRLAGMYPKDFKFWGWHPQCLCYATPEQMSDEEYNRMEDQILNGEPITVSGANVVQHPPAEFGKYLKENKKALEGMKNKPYWMRDNPDYVDSAVKSVDKPLPVAGSQKISVQFTKIAPSVKSHVTHALQSIDAVHGDGILDDIPFVKSPSKKFNGSFTSDVSGRARQISLTDIGISNQPEITVAHEMGHYLDLYGVGKKGSWNSMQKDSPIAKVVSIARESNSMKRIQQLIDDGFVKVDGIKVRHTSKIKKHLQYLNSSKEVWARAYAQFIAEKSGSEKMLAGLKATIQRDQQREWLAYQWEMDDFADISAAIEKMMIDEGWIVSQ